MIQRKFLRGRVVARVVAAAGARPVTRCGHEIRHSAGGGRLRGWLFVGAEFAHDTNQQAGDDHQYTQHARTQGTLPG